MRKLVRQFLKIGLPLLLACIILWWMYRGIKWEEISQSLISEMDWTWMILSLPFGISAQVFRALRWRQSLEPLGEHPRTHTCIHSIFLSYASSLVIPRSGEILRCGVLSRYEGINFSRSVGTVVTERAIDISMVLFLCLATFLSQIPVFMRFFQTTGMSLQGFLSGFSLNGYLVTFASLVFAISGLYFLARRFQFMTRAHSMLEHIRQGLVSVLKVRKPWLFLVYSVGIWASYYLHFYITFYCFSFTADLGPMVALVAFVVGCIAVIVPTPNGAGPWHFAVKTVLMLYGVSDVLASLFALIVHTIQTILIMALGIYSLVALTFVTPRPSA